MKIMRFIVVALAFAGALSFFGCSLDSSVDSPTTDQDYEYTMDDDGRSIFSDSTNLKGCN